MSDINEGNFHTSRTSISYRKMRFVIVNPTSLLAICNKWGNFDNIEIQQRLSACITDIYDAILVPEFFKRCHHLV